MFERLYKELMNPRNWKVNLGMFTFEFDQKNKQELIEIVSLIQSKGVFNNKIPTELWLYVFRSLSEFSSSLNGVYKQISLNTTKDALKAVDFLRFSVREFMSEYRDDYFRFHNNPTDANYSPRADWDWPLLSKAAHDLYILRKIAYEIGKKLEIYSLNKNISTWRQPQIMDVYPFIRSHKVDAFISECNVKLSYNPTGNEISDGIDLGIAGSWNDWKIDKSQFFSEGQFLNHRWVFFAKFPPGKYLYKFVVNEQWILDPSNSISETDEHGNTNSVLIVEPTLNITIDSIQTLSGYKHFLTEELRKIEEGITTG
jgi:hypothetical protein